ncbi:MAG TPA: hypothetical protein VIN08_24690 [Ohtaekwangia sp.]|uniref:hypothetical protein n=1 Tax=Ohtaekwangia sp. TaxID=2066019 RepID=UPI002F9350F3
MKKTLLIMMALLAIVSSAVYARRAENPAPTLGVGIMKKGSTFHVYYKADKSSDVKVSIFNAKGDRVFTEVIRKVDGFIRPYNFSDLAEGEYTFEVYDGAQRQTQVVNYHTERGASLAHLTRIGGENKYLLTVPKKSPGIVSIKIYGEKSQLLYKEQLKHINDFARMFNLSQVNEKVFFELTDEKGNSEVLRY